MNQKPLPQQINSFKELEREWYQKLEGFDDCEDIDFPDRPLKDWHSLKFIPQAAQIRRDEAERYFDQIELFINHEEAYEMCCLMTKHPNSTLWPEDVVDILDLHRSGFSERKIAEKVNRGKKCVHLTIQKARAWMKVV